MMQFPTVVNVTGVQNQLWLCEYYSVLCKTDFHRTCTSGQENRMKIKGKVGQGGVTVRGRFFQVLESCEEVMALVNGDISRIRFCLSSVPGALIDL